MDINFSETYPKLDAEQLEVMRSMSAGEKLQVLNDLIEHTRQSILARLRDQYPLEQPDRIRRRLSTVLLGTELATKVYGPEPDPPTIEIPVKTLWYVPPRKSPQGISQPI